MRRGDVYIGVWPTFVCHEYSLALVILAGFISMARPPPDEAAWPLAADSQLLAAAVTPLPPV